MNRFSRHPTPTVSRFANIRAPQEQESFYTSDAWREVRYRALKASNGRCQCCAARPGPGNPLHIDHIRPRSKFPKLELELSNLQVLCADCNLGKRAWDETDWRPNESPKTLRSDDRCLWLPKGPIALVSPGTVWSARTPQGGWTREQLAEWGIPWPPPKGWRIALLRAWAENKNLRGQGNPTA